MGRSDVDFRVTNACSEAWEQMRGDVRARHCEHCAKVVHNLVAMTPREVERLALRMAVGESVCARVTRDAAGELVTLQPRNGVRPTTAAAGLILAAMLSSASTKASAQVSGAAGQAVLTGRIVAPNGNPLPYDAHGPIYLLDASGNRFDGTMEKDGRFSVSAPPGEYELVARGNAIVAGRLRAMTLHEGMQSTDHLPIQVGLGETGATATMGELITVFVRPSPIKHPVWFLRYVGYRLKRAVSE